MSGGKMSGEKVNEYNNNSIVLRDSDNTVTRIDAEFRRAVEELEKAIFEKRKKIAKKKTPKRKINKKAGYDYVPAADMLNALNEDFPIWSWRAAGANPVQQVMNWIIVSGELEVIDNGIKRTFFSPGAAQIQVKSGSDPTDWRNVLSIANTVKSANTVGFHKAINVLTGEFSDVYQNAPEEPISIQQRHEVMDCISKAEEINNKYSLKAFENQYGDLDNWSIEDYEKAMSILTKIIGE